MRFQSFPAREAAAERGKSGAGCGADRRRFLRRNCYWNWSISAVKPRSARGLSKRFVCCCLERRSK